MEELRRQYQALIAEAFKVEREPAGVALERIGLDEMKDELARLEMSVKENQSTMWESPMF